LWVVVENSASSRVSRSIGLAFWTLHNDRRIGALLGHQPHAVNPLAVFLDELAALVLVDGPGNAVREKPVAVLPSSDTALRAPAKSCAFAGLSYILHITIFTGIGTREKNPLPGARS
jgi:hypothetical protein